MSPPHQPLPTRLPTHPRYVWDFKRRFRRGAFGWRSRPAVLRVQQAVSEIRCVARLDAVLAAEGAMCLLERLSPALGQVDSSSGAIGTAVNKAISALVPIIASAPVDAKVREKWLDRLWLALQEGQMPYIEWLADFWGDLCASKECASEWADRLLDLTHVALDPDRPYGFVIFAGTTACLSALYRAERYDLILELLPVGTLSSRRDWAVNALIALGRQNDASRYADACDAGIRARHVRR